MEHITIKELYNGFIKLIPDKSYRLYNIRTKQSYSEAVVKEIKLFIAVKIDERNI